MTAQSPDESRWRLVSPIVYAAGSYENQAAHGMALAGLASIAYAICIDTLVLVRRRRSLSRANLEGTT